jgi:hypothetical protein
MSDNLQQAWQSQSLPPRLTIDTELLLAEVRRNQRYFTAVIFWRDVREVGIALILIPVLIVMGIKMNLPWTWYLLIPGTLWIAGYMLLDRLRQRKHHPQPDDSLIERVKVSLAQIEHQIELLRNIFWWYIMPVALPAALFIGHVIYQGLSAVWHEGPAVVALLGLCLALIAVVPILIGIITYRINQHAIHTDLQPRRAELTALLASLQEEK